jgi:hypothetical protein
MELLEVYDWALRGIIEAMQVKSITDAERAELDRKLKEVALMYVIEENKKTSR